MTALGAGTLHAEVVWSDDFTGQTTGAFPNRDFTGNSTNDWAATSSPGMFQVTASTGSPAPSLAFTDSNTGAQGVLRLQMSDFSEFSTADPETPLLRLSFDWKIQSFASATTTEAFRLIWRANGSMASLNQLVIGFNRADLNDGDGLGGDLAFYAASPNTTSNAAATDATAIGLIPGVGWQPGFDFGQYSATASENTTDGLFYRFAITYNYETGLMDGVVSRLAEDATNGQSASFSLALNANLEFSNSDATDVMLIASTNSVTGVAQFDNFAFESVPEPSVAVALAAGTLVLAGRRRSARSSRA